MIEESTHEAIVRFTPSEILISGPASLVQEIFMQSKDLINGIVNKMSPSEMIENKPNLHLKVIGQDVNRSIEDAEVVDMHPTTDIQYNSVIWIEGNKIQIISDVYGKSTTQRMINLVLLYLWGKLQIGIEEVSFSELRQVCEKHGEFDSSNFARHLNNQKRFFLVSGTGKSQKAKLIRPGIKEAELLIQTLSNRTA
ncbi:MAG TPA: hypothetical protein VK588_14120 [Chitinophagaceae bacterium]|nr:hypothetical protein [Chitinophagaceae bacterium]